jgi:hypothetical protein
MKTLTVLKAALATTAFVSCSAFSAAVLTLNPQANNGLGVNGIIDAATPAFQTVGLQSNLTGSLVIAGNSGAQLFSETGNIAVTSFQDALNNTVASGVFTNYQINGAYTITGGGAWAGNVFNVAPGGLSVSLVLTAISATAQVINLGTATLAPGLAVAFAVAAGTLNPGDSGVGLTSFSATLDFTPAAGTTGANGFFQAPSPFAINLAVGNAGGNTLNTGYSVAADGKVTFVVPTAGANQGTANITFVNKVPEPGVLSLLGVVLIGAGVAGKRKFGAKAA